MLTAEQAKTMKLGDLVAAYAHGECDADTLTSGLVERTYKQPLPRQDTLIAQNEQASEHQSAASIDGTFRDVERHFMMGRIPANVFSVAKAHQLATARDNGRA